MSYCYTLHALPLSWLQTGDVSATPSVFFFTKLFAVRTPECDGSHLRSFDKNPLFYPDSFLETAKKLRISHCKGDWYGVLFCLCAAGGADRQLMGIISYYRWLRFAHLASNITPRLRSQIQKMIGSVDICSQRTDITVGVDTAHLFIELIVQEKQVSLQNIWVNLYTLEELGL